MSKVYCKHCFRWYFTKIDQCEIPFENLEEPNTGLISVEQYKWAKKNLEYIHYAETVKKPEYYTAVGEPKTYKLKSKIFGHPSQLNKTNECPFYKGLPNGLKWLTPLIRMWS